MEQPPTLPIVELDNLIQGFNDFDDATLSQSSTNDTLTSSTSQAKEGKQQAKTC